MKKKNDAILVNETLSGDREAFAVLVRRHQDYAYGTAIGLLSDFELAQDVVQEAFLVAYRDLGKLKNPERFGIWLRSIVRHTARNALRELARVRSMADELRHMGTVWALPVLSDQSEPETEQRELVHRALARLNEIHREVVSLYYVGRLSYADIAAFLGVTETAVQGRLQRARRQLREELKMVKEQFEEEGLPEAFSDEIRRVLDWAIADRKNEAKAVERISELGPPAVEPLCEALEDPRIQARHVAAFALCAIGDTRAVKPLLGLLFTSNAFHIVHGYRKWLDRFFGIPGMREALLDLVRQDQANWVVLNVRARAGEDEEVFEVIRAYYRRSKKETALAVLCDLMPETGMDLVLEALEGSDQAFRIAGISAAYWRQMTPPLQACLTAFENCVTGHKGQRMHRGFQAIDLIHRHGEAGSRALVDLMEADDPAVRIFAAVGLGKAGSEEAFEVLTEEFLKASKDKRWEKSIWQSLGRFFRPELEAWIEAEGERLKDVPSIVWSLARRKPTPKPGRAIGALERLYETGTPSVKRAAIKLLVAEKGENFVPELRRWLEVGKPRSVARQAFHEMELLGDAALPAAEEMFLSERWTERKASVCLLRRWNKLTADHKARAEEDEHLAVRLAAAGKR